jgi:hypothetical protein
MNSEQRFSCGFRRILPVERRQGKHQLAIMFRLALRRCSPGRVVQIVPIWVLPRLVHWRPTAIVFPIRHYSGGLNESLTISFAQIRDAIDTAPLACDDVLDALDTDLGTAPPRPEATG